MHTWTPNNCQTLKGCSQISPELNPNFYSLKKVVKHQLTLLLFIYFCLYLYVPYGMRLPLAFAMRRETCVLPL